MARFKEGDKVRVKTRAATLEDSAETHYYGHMAGLTGVVENYYSDTEIAVKVDLEALPDVAKRVHKDATKRMRTKFEDSIGSEQKGQLMFLNCFTRRSGERLANQGYNPSGSTISKKKINVKQTSNHL